MEDKNYIVVFTRKGEEQGKTIFTITESIHGQHFLDGVQQASEKWGHKISRGEDFIENEDGKYEIIEIETEHVEDEIIETNIHESYKAEGKLYWIGSVVTTKGTLTYDSYDGDEGDLTEEEFIEYMKDGADNFEW